MQAQGPGRRSKPQGSLGLYRDLPLDLPTANLLPLLLQMGPLSEAPQALPFHALAMYHSM